VIRGIVDGRLDDSADRTCAEMLLRMAGLKPQQAKRYTVAAEDVS
jgi:hypothetical protein